MTAADLVAGALVAAAVAAAWDLPWSSAELAATRGAWERVVLGGWNRFRGRPLDGAATDRVLR